MTLRTWLINKIKSFIQNLLSCPVMYETVETEVIRVVLQEVQTLISEFIRALKLLHRVLDIVTCAFSGITRSVSLKLLD